MKRRQFVHQLVKLALSGSLVSLAPYVYSDTAKATVSKVYLRDVEGALQLVVDADMAIQHTIFKLSNPERVVLDLKAAKLSNSKALVSNLIGPVNQVRYADRGEDDLRIVLDMSKQVEIKSVLLPVALGPAHQLVVSLGGSSLPVAPVIETATPVAQVEEQSVVAVRDIIVAIDAGHGGKDPGAVGKKGTKEKDIVLNIARKLKKLIDKQDGYKAVLTRDSDIFIPLRGRIDIARKANADLFISIHADAAKNRKAEGSSVYILSNNGASSEAARWLAQKENAVDLIGGVNLEGRDKVLAQVLLDLSQRHTLENSNVVATDLLDELKSIGKTHSPRVEKAAFVVLKSPDIPSVLVETAYISNPKEEKRLRTDAHQEKLAKTLLVGIKNYFVKNPPEGTRIAETRVKDHIIQSGETLSGIANRYRITLSELKVANNLENDLIKIGQRLKIP